ncbi:hypothetical protein [Streptomyces zaomyceticus]|uniref:hypothetical protein n=1 Tax=Streptomyces zaomyceticus TaxID=68286 RepID=UPI00324C4364
MEREDADALRAVPLLGSCFVREHASLAEVARPQESVSLNRNPTCCFCWLIVDLEQDGEAQELRLGLARSSEVRQLVYSHSSCLRERIHPNMDLWWEF